MEIVLCLHAESKNTRKLQVYHLSIVHCASLGVAEPVLNQGPAQTLLCLGFLGHFDEKLSLHVQLTS